MNKVEKILVERLMPILAEEGFNWRKARATFIRNEPFGFSSFSWASYETQEDGGRLELVPLLAVRHDVVEDVVNELGLVHGEANRKFTATVDRGLGFFPFEIGRDEKLYMRVASAEADVEQATSSIGSMLNSNGRMFFERYSSLLECSRGLNHPIESKTHPLCNSFPRRAYSGVAAAFFSERGRVPELVSQYIDFARAVQPNHCRQIAKRLDQLVQVAQSRQ